MAAIRELCNNICKQRSSQMLCLMPILKTRQDNLIIFTMSDKNFWNINTI